MKLNATNTYELYFFFLSSSLLFGSHSPFVNESNEEITSYVKIEKNTNAKGIKM